MSDAPKSVLRRLFEALRTDACKYFRDLARHVKEEPDSFWRSRLSRDHFWRRVLEDAHQTAHGMAQRVVRYSAQVAEAMRAAPLVGTEDLTELRHYQRHARVASAP